MINRGRVQVFFEPGSSATHQEFKLECDIRNIMKKYKKTGLIDHLTSVKEKYGDFSNIPDYQESLNIVIEAQDSFNRLPSDVRKRFSNDPGQFVDFMGNPENHDEQVKMGLIPAPVVSKSEAIAEPDSRST